VSYMLRLQPSKSLILKNNSQFPVSICKNTPLKLREPDEQFDTILRVLEVRVAYTSCTSVLESIFTNTVQDIAPTYTEAFGHSKWH